MPEQISVTTVGYQCAGCDRIVEAETPWTEDYPEGYYVNIRRVTEHLNHKVTGEVYVCSKECLLDLVNYRINTYAVAVDPVLPPGQEWDRRRKEKKRRQS